MTDNEALEVLLSTRGVRSYMPALYAGMLENLCDLVGKGLLSYNEATAMLGVFQDTMTPEELEDARTHQLALGTAAIR